jgi:hypothetical protein
MTECRSCGAPIRFVFTAMGGRMPIDLEPNPDGNVYLRGHTAHVIKADTVLPPGEPRYMSHHATCPQAEKWRRRANPRAARR